MNSRRTIMRIPTFQSSSVALSVLAGVLLAGCAGSPAMDANYNAAQAEYNAASNDPKVAQPAPEQLRQASDALQQSDKLKKDGAPQADVDHYSHIASQKVAVARQLASADASQAYIKQAGAQRNQVLLQASQQQ